MYFKLFAKCRWKFPVAFLYQSVNIDDIMLFSAKRRWNFPLIFYICLQHVDGNFQRHFLNLFKDTDDICFAFKTSVKLFIAKMPMELLIAKCRWKFPSTSFYLLRISMIFCFGLAKRRWKISSILCIYFQNVDGNFHRQFASISKSDSNLQGFQSNIFG